MKCDGVIDTVAVLLEADPSALERDEVAALVRSSARVRAWLDSFDVLCARRTRELAAVGQAEPAESLLGGCGGRSGKDAVAVGERERVCGQLSSFEAALAGGSIGSGHVDAVAHATSKLDDQLLAVFAETRQNCWRLRRRTVSMRSIGSAVTSLASWWLEPSTGLTPRNWTRNGLGQA